MASAGFPSGADDRVIQQFQTLSLDNTPNAKPAPARDKKNATDARIQKAADASMGATAGDTRAAKFAMAAAAAPTPMPAPEEVEKKIRAAVTRVSLPSPIWGKIGSFLTIEEAIALLKERSLADLVSQRGQRKAEQQKRQEATATAAAAAARAGSFAFFKLSWEHLRERFPSSSITDVERKATRGFAAAYWPEAAQKKEDDFAIRFVQALITKGTPFPYEFPAGFGESARDQVQQLSLKGDTITPDILKELHRCFPNLQSLTVKDTDISNPHLQQVAQWKGLQSLTLGHCANITHKGLEYLKGLSHLHTVKMAHLGNVTRVGFSHLTSLSSLRHLLLPSYHNNVTDECLDQLVSCPHLISLDIGSGSTVTDAGFAKIAGLTELRSLSFGEFMHVTDQGYAPLAQLTQLERLRVQSGAFNIDILKNFLPSLIRLLHLDFSNSYSGFRDNELNYLATQRHLRDQLESLDISYCTSITSEGLAHLTSFTRLQDLRLGYLPNADKALQNLYLLKSVKNLNLKNAQGLTGLGLLSLGRCVQLEKLNLSNYYHITNSDLLNLAPLVYLQVLTIRGCTHITDAGCKALKRAIIERGGSANLKIIR